LARYKQDKEKIRAAARNHPNREEIKRKKNIRRRQQLRELREEVIAHYGGRCTCCGETTYEFLTLDHVNNDGGKQRELLRQMLGRGTQFSYSSANLAKKLDYPDYFQILCWNCNCAKAHHGICPHQFGTEPKSSS
jgi:hypothetical protein